ncbi:hypothetical protein diail_1880 [Diaporthe ilicicola]|nr:hypothetical protein diail_1880 [Diaporthe ilicicola]
MALRLATTTLNLPDGPLDVVVGEATSEQQLQCCKLAGSAFAAPLSMDQYLELEEYLGSRPLNVEGAIRHWCLFPKNDPNCILATCKTIHRFFLFKDGQSTLRQGDGYCVASVITNPDYRNSGLASVLMGHVAEWMDGPGNGTASMLYTSIGDFYAKRGWGPLPAFESTLRLRTDRAMNGRFNLPANRFLGSGDISSLCERDVESVKKEMLKTQISADQTLASVAPTADVVNLLQERASFVASKQCGKITQRRGAISGSEESWIYWYHDFRKEQLAVLRVHLPDESNQRQFEEVASLLLDALEEASAWTLPKVTVWDANPDVIQALNLLKDQHGVEITSGQRSLRSIPSLRWKGGEGSKKVTLRFNEFYAWS